MEITFSGYFFILLGLYAFIWNKKLLYFLTIFVVPFTATSVINIGDFRAGSGIQPYIIFTFLNIIYIFISIISNFKIIGRQLLEFRISISCFILLIFTGIAFLSLIVPFYIDGGLYGNTTGILGVRDPINFSIKNITQFLYLLLGVGFSFIVFKHSDSQSSLDQTLKVYGYSMFFVLLWGFVQVVCFWYGISYPNYLFNNSANPAVYDSLIISSIDGADGTLTLSSVGAEPSILVQSIVIYIPFLIFGQIYKKYIFSRIIDAILIGLLIIFCIYTGSSTGLISILTIIFVSIIFILINYSKKNILKALRMLLFSAASFVIFLFVFWEKFYTMIFDKIDSFSALERADTIISSWESFLEFPILGVGWGTVASGTMALKILSSTGILGGFIFFSLIMNIFYSLIKVRRIELRDSSQAYYSESMLVSLFVMLIAATIAGFSSVFGNYWFVIGLSLGISKVSFQKK